jgi:hypothetical protein
MAATKTDNSNFAVKVAMREKLARGTVLDCYHGNGLLWAEVKKTHPEIKVIGIEKELGKGDAVIYGDCEKVLPSLNLAKYDIIDLDAYGIPFNALESMFGNRTLKAGTVVYYTFIQSLYGRIPNKLLSYIGITKEMIKKAPTMFGKLGFQSFLQYLLDKKVKKCYNVCINRKNYGYFII